MVYLLARLEELEGRVLELEAENKRLKKLPKKPRITASSLDKVADQGKAGKGKGGDTAGALSAFHAARDQATEQGALLFRIRAEVAIARWHRHAGDLDAARATLEAIWAEMNEEVRELVDGEGVKRILGST